MNSVLITGGTGTFGNAFVRLLLTGLRPSRIIVLGRDEYKQQRMASALRDEFPDAPDRMRFFVGDIRDLHRLERAFRGVDVVVHAAAMKQVSSCEYNPDEAVKTNVLGSRNIIDAAIAAGVRRVVALSTDKAVQPTNLYGATKLLAEKMFLAARVYSDRTQFVVVRYGNVVGSRGSVFELWREAAATGRTPIITNPEATRFWLTAKDAVGVVGIVVASEGAGRLFIPQATSSSLLVALHAAVDRPTHITTGSLGRGEKVHEVLMTHEESSRAVALPWGWEVFQDEPPDVGRVTQPFVYTSDTNPDRIYTPEALRSKLHL